MPLIQRKAKLNDFLVGRYESTHRPQIHNAIRTPVSLTIGSKGQYYSSVGRRNENDMIYVYHVELQRAKFKQEKAYSGNSRKSKRILKSSKSVKVRQKVWKLRVFAIPSSRVKSVKQYARHFDLVLV
jgi:hypothetical protein